MQKLIIKGKRDLIGKISISGSKNATLPVGKSGGAAGKRGQIVYTKIPYSACMNSFRIQRLDSFHAISHGIPIRPGSGPPRRPNRSGMGRVHCVCLRVPGGDRDHGTRTMPGCCGTYLLQLYGVADKLHGGTVGPDLPEFLVTISEFTRYKLVLIHIL